MQNLEFYVYKITAMSGHWTFLSSTTFTDQTVNYDSMLSITILPTFFSSVLNINGELVFKILYQIVFSLVPLTLYRVYERYIPKLVSLASMFFFVSGVLVFYGISPISLDRQIIGSFFLVISIFVLLNDKIPVKARKGLLFAFGIALLVSHYSLMYIYLALILLIYITFKIKHIPNNVLTGKLIIIILITSLVWYSISITPLASLINFFSILIFRFIPDLFNHSALTTQNFVSSSSNIINSLSIAIFLIPNFFVALGIIYLVLKPKKNHFDLIFRLITFFGAAILVLSFAIPNFAPSLNLDRFYGISLLFVAPCFPLGVIFFFKFCKKIFRLRKTYSIISKMIVCVLLVSFLFAQTGFLNRIMEQPPLLRSVDLDRVAVSNDTQIQLSFYRSYIQQSDISSALWLSKNMPPNSVVYADNVARFRSLISYGLINTYQIEDLVNNTYLQQDGFIYLGQLNVKYGIISTNSVHGFYKTSEISKNLDQSNLIYSNGNSQICSISTLDNYVNFYQ